MINYPFLHINRTVKKKEPKSKEENPAYWEAILRNEGLGMDRGLHPNVYIGDTYDLDRLTQGSPVSITGHYGTVDGGDEE